MSDYLIKPNSAKESNLCMFIPGEMIIDPIWQTYFADGWPKKPPTSNAKVGCLTTSKWCNDWRDFGNPTGSPSGHHFLEKLGVPYIQVLSFFGCHHCVGWWWKVLSFFSSITDLSSSFQGTSTIFVKKWLQRLRTYTSRRRNLCFPHSEKFGSRSKKQKKPLTLKSNSLFRWPLGITPYLEQGFLQGPTIMGPFPRAGPIAFPYFKGFLWE